MLLTNIAVANILKYVMFVIFAQDFTYNKIIQILFLTFGQDDFELMFKKVTYCSD